MFADNNASNASQDLIKEGSDATFVQDVVEASKAQPVLVDFYATWCGPCKQLTPVLEKVVAASGGQVKLVKIDAERNPGAAQSLRVQSFPIVYAFVDGRPVDGFQGALPESQVRAFVEGLAKGGQSGPSQVDQLLEMGTESLKVEDPGGAAQAFAHVLQLDPTNEKAIAGMARVYLLGDDVEQARQTIAMAPIDSTDADVVGVRSAIALQDAPRVDLGPLEAKVKADPKDAQARFGLAEGLASSGQMDAAVDHLLTLLEQDREWNDGAAHKRLLTLFEAAGPTSETAKNGRRRLSSLLFS